MNTEDVEAQAKDRNLSTVVEEIPSHEPSSSTAPSNAESRSLATETARPSTAEPVTGASARPQSPSPSYRSALPPAYNRIRHAFAARPATSSTQIPKPERAECYRRIALLISELLGIILFGISINKQNLSDYYGGNVYVLPSQQGEGWLTVRP